jgi:hypothetical protein
MPKTVSVAEINHFTILPSPDTSLYQNIPHSPLKEKSDCFVLELESDNMFVPYQYFRLHDTIAYTLAEICGR